MLIKEGEQFKRVELPIHVGRQLVVSPQTVDLKTRVRFPPVQNTILQYTKFPMEKVIEAKLLEIELNEAELNKVWTTFQVDTWPKRTEFLKKVMAADAYYDLPQSPEKEYQFIKEIYLTGVWRDAKKRY